MLPVDSVVLTCAVALSGVTAAWLVTAHLREPAAHVAASIDTCQFYAIEHRGDLNGCQ